MPNQHDDGGGSWSADLPAGRAVTLDEFYDYLRTTTNRDGRPYEAASISAYLGPAKALDDHPSPYTAKLSRYAEVKGRPTTLSADFIDDLLQVTGGGKARDFEAARDHAIIRTLRSEGIRRQKVLSMVMHTLPAALIRTPCSAWCRSKALESREMAGW